MRYGFLQVDFVAAVGALEFVTDFVVLYLAVSGVGLGHLSGRLEAPLVAATVTWKEKFDSTFAASDKGAVRQWMQYMLATSRSVAIKLASARSV